MKTSKTGINLIKLYEGFRATPYKAVPSERFLTIGYGHYGSDVTPDMHLTKDEAEELLKRDLVRYEKAVMDLQREWTQNEFDALVSFTYNCGIANLKTLVRNRDKHQIADAFLLYNKAGGRVLTGLVRRRETERRLFIRNDQLKEVALEVIDGKWGNGADRKYRLQRAGYNYSEVQSLVNNILTGESK